MDIESLDDFFSEYSEEVFALLSGIVIIITIIFFIYGVRPLWDPHSLIVLLSLLSFLVCFSAPIFFRLSDMTLVPDVVGWLLGGVSIALFGWVIFHGGYYLREVVLTFQYIVPSGIFGFLSSFPLTKGVFIPLFGEGDLSAFGIESEDEEDFEEEFEETEESEEEGQIERDFEESTGRYEEKDTLDEEKFPEEDNEPW